MDNSKLKCFMPNICWHKDGASDVFAIISIDIQQKSLPIAEETNNDDSVIEIDAEEGCKRGAVYKIVTTNNQEARIWEFHFEPDKKPDGSESTSLRVDFLADIRTGQASMNVVRFSPNGELLAIGDVEGTVLVYKLLGKATSANPPPTVARIVADGNMEESTLPPNKENWSRAFVYKHEYIAGVQEVTSICFSPDSSTMASASMDRTLLCYGTGNKKRLWCVKGFRYIVKGIAWDPRGKYIVTLSTSRYFDVVDAKKGTRLRSCYQVDLPETLVDERMKILQKAYKLFHDDQLVSFTLGVDWSPCGSIVVTPAAHLDLEEGDLDGCYVFKREDLADCKPTALFPTRKATRMVKFSPVIYKLRNDGDCNFLGLPHRVVWAVMCKTSVLLYDSQHAFPFSHIDNIHVLDLTHLAWTPDGKVLVISSEEGYNTFITIDADVLGEVLDPAATIPATFVDAENAPDSPKLKRVVKRKPKAPPELLATNGIAVEGGEIIVQLQGDGVPADGGAAATMP